MLFRMTMATIVEGLTTESAKNETRLAKIHESTRLTLERHFEIGQLTVLTIQ